MNAAGQRSSAIRAMLGVVAAAATITVIAQLTIHPQSALLRINSVVFRSEAALGYLLGLFYSLRVAQDFPKRSRMRLGWSLMSTGIACLFTYQALDVVLYAFRSLVNTATMDLWLIGISTSLLLLLGGLLCMWLSYRNAGLVKPLTRTDWAVVVVFAALTAARLARGLDIHHTSASQMIRWIRSASPLLVGASAVVAFLLYRVTMSFGGGRLSSAIRYLIAFFTIHLALFQLDWYPSIWDNPLVDAVTDAIYYTLPWLLAVGVADRWNLTLRANEIAEQYEMGDILDHELVTPQGFS